MGRNSIMNGGVRTRARTLALQNDTVSYIQLRSRRLVKPTATKRHRIQPKMNKDSAAGSSKRDLGVDGEASSIGENIPEIETKERDMPPKGRPLRHTAQGNQEAHQELVPMSSAVIELLVAQRVADAIASYEANRNSRAGGSNGAGSSDTAGGLENAARGCSYKEFLNCKPKNFSGTEGPVGLLRWFEKLESVFRISNCSENCKVKYVSCTLQDSALTWWNSYARSVGIDAAYQTPWEDLKQMMKDKYCFINELHKLKGEFLYLSVKGTDIAGYTDRFQELALLFPTMVTPGYMKIERYIWGLTPQIQGLVTLSKPTSIQGAIRMANDLIDQVACRGTMVEKNAVVRSSDGKRKWEGNPGRNYGQQSGRRPETVRAYTAEPSFKKGYTGNRPLCIKCNLHHLGPCISCWKCRKPGHQAKDCRNLAPAANSRAARSCFECGIVGHFRQDCPRLRNQNGGNARGRAFVTSVGDARQDPNIVTGH